MENELWVQLIGYVLSGAVALLVASKQHNKTAALMEYRLEQLEKKMDKHNNFIERLTMLEVRLGMKKDSNNG